MEMSGVFVGLFFFFLLPPAVRYGSPTPSHSWKGLPDPVQAPAVWAFCLVSLFLRVVTRP